MIAAMSSEVRFESLDLPCTQPDPDDAGLWEAYFRTGHGSAAEDELVEQHLALIKTVVGRFAISLPARIEVRDLYTAGRVGLLNAIRRFRPQKGGSFTVHARERIRSAVLDELRRSNWAPESLRETAGAIRKVIRQLEGELGRVPHESEIARAMDLSLEDYHELLGEIGPATFVTGDSITSNAEAARDNGASAADDEAGATPAQAARAAQLEQRIKELPGLQRQVLALYYNEDLRLREIAEVLDLPESRICEIHAQAILALSALTPSLTGRSEPAPQCVAHRGNGRVRDSRPLKGDSGVPLIARLGLPRVNLGECVPA
jgi:RNA polymerase sigma factor for flagellar operon FliA